jgi:hypothetical protein
MKYVYREKNKFPHILYISNESLRDSGITVKVFKDVYPPWLNETFGAYGIRWRSPPTIYGTRNDELFIPYSFLNIEDAMAFKLRWS